MQTWIWSSWILITSTVTVNCDKQLSCGWSSRPQTWDVCSATNEVSLLGSCVWSVWGGPDSLHATVSRYICVTPMFLSLQRVFFATTSCRWFTSCTCCCCHGSCVPTSTPSEVGPPVFVCTSWHLCLFVKSPLHRRPWLFCLRCKAQGGALQTLLGAVSALLSPASLW